MTIDTLTAALGYVGRGWALVPIKPGGKRPLEKNWPNQLARTPDEVRAMLTRWPTCNLGIATGYSSNFWVLDIDPDNGGAVALAGLVQAYGPLPETYAVTTGSGGTHYYFLMPDFEPRNHQGGSKLPDGLDARGYHGQVVAPPSHTDKGAYSVLLDVPIQAAPDWLLDMIRPAPIPDPVEAPSYAAPVPVGQLAERGPAYAYQALQGCLAELASAGRGARNDTAFRVACRLVELTNATWSGLDFDAVKALYDQAARAADRDGTFSWAEADQAWRGACTRIGAQAAELPYSANYGLGVTFDQLGITGAALDFSSPVPSPPGGSDGTGFLAIDAGSAATMPLVDHMEAEAYRLALGMKVRARAAEIYQEMITPPADWSARMLTVDQLDQLGEPVPLVVGLLFRDSLARMVGPSNQGKTFVAVDLACHIAAGLSWHGRAVVQAPAVIVVAEGATGIRVRIRAWMARHEIAELPDLHVLPEPIQSTGATWKGWAAHLAPLRPGLIVLDTQARITEGVNENDAAEMGLAVGAWDHLRSVTSACVMPIHHRGLTGTHGRGSTVVYAALETELDVSSKGSTLTLAVSKQRNAEKISDLTFTLTPWAGSLILVAGGDDGTGAAQAVIDLETGERIVTELPMGERRLAVLVDVLKGFKLIGGTKADAQAIWLTLCAERGIAPAVAGRRKLWSRAWTELATRGRIWSAGGKFGFLPIEGQSDLTANPEAYAPGTWPAPPIVPFAPGTNGL